MKLERAFTLIELLVTISIIAILASIIFVSFGEARVNSQNKAMTVELKEMQLALETYRSQHGKYPFPEPGCASAPMGQLLSRASGPGSWCSQGYLNSSTFIEPVMIPEFIKELPLRADSANPNCDIEYRTDTGGTWYKLTAVNCLAGVDMVSGVGPNEPLARCAISCAQGSSGDTCFPNDADYYESLAIYSLGGQCE